MAKNIERWGLRLRKLIGWRILVGKSGIAVGGGSVRNAGEVMNHSSTSTLGDGQMPNISASLPSGDFESR